MVFSKKKIEKSQKQKKIAEFFNGKTFNNKKEDKQKRSQLKMS
jgi:hypothetical protein